MDTLYFTGGSDWNKGKSYSNYIYYNYFEYKKLINLIIIKHNTYIRAICDQERVKRSNVLGNFFTYRVVNYWNNLSAHVVNSPTIETFKNRLSKIENDLL